MLSLMQGNVGKECAWETGLADSFLWELGIQYKYKHKHKSIGVVGAVVDCGVKGMAWLLLSISTGFPAICTCTLYVVLYMEWREQIRKDPKINPS